MGMAFPSAETGAQYLRPLEPEELASMENDNEPELPVTEISRQDSAASSFDINV